MTNKIPFKWETILNTYQKGLCGMNTHRAQVYGGWLVSQEIYTDVLNEGNERKISNCICFIPDPEHLWRVE